MRLKEIFHNKPLFWGVAFVSALLFIAAVLLAVYPVLDAPGGAIMTPGGYYSETGATGKAWLNGFLGVFFKFKYLGNIHWLLIPLAIWFFSVPARRERHYLAPAFVLAGLFLLIAIKGYFSTRYQLTLFPASAFLTLVLLWRFLQGKPRFLKPLAIAAIILISGFNIHHYRELYTLYWKTAVSRETPHFPHRLIAWLNHPSRDFLDTTHRLLVMNRPIFYYYTRRKGIDYKRHDSWQAMRLFSEKSGGQSKRIYDILRHQLAVGFLLLKDSERQLLNKGQLEEFLNSQCVLEIRDNGWLLYKLRDRSLEETFKDPQFRKLNVWNPLRRRPTVISPSLTAWLTRGVFNFQAHSEREERPPVERRFIDVSNVSPDAKGERIINFGYEFTRNGLEHPIPAGQYVHFLVHAALPPELLKSPSQIFISDYDGKTWESTVIRFTSPGTRAYLVSRKIRANSQRVLAGFRFAPQSPSQLLSFRDPEIYVSAEGL